MNQRTNKKERAVILNGRPSLDRLPKAERRLFLSSLLDLMVEMREEKNNEKNAKTESL